MALNYNSVTLSGRLTADPELKTTPNGVFVTQFALAVNRKYAKKGETVPVDFFNIIAWRNTAEFVTKNFTKGSAMFVVGELQQRTWQDKDGKTRHDVIVVASEVLFVESKKNTNAAVSAPTTSGEAYTPAPEEYEDDSDVDSDLPF